MNGSPSTMQERDEIAQQAQRWHLRLKDESAGGDDRRAFEAWLAQDSAHALAYARAEALWAALAGPSALLAADGWHRSPLPRRRRRSRSFVWAAAASIALAAVLFWWRDPGLAMRMVADYATSPGEQRQLALADGSQVLLDVDSAIRISASGQERTVTLLRGRAWFDVAHDAERPFTVTAGAAQVRVLGTAFSVDRLPGGVAVAVERGRVAVSGGQGAEPLLLNAGERARPAAAAGLEHGRSSAETAFAWRRGLTVFDQASLENVAEVLTRLGLGRVIVFDDALRSERMSGVFRSEEPAAILQAIENGLDVKVTRIPGVGIFIHR